MYYVYLASGPSVLIESTDSVIKCGTMSIMTVLGQPSPMTDDDCDSDE